MGGLGLMSRYSPHKERRATIANKMHFERYSRFGNPETSALERDARKVRQQREQERRQQRPRIRVWRVPVKE
jgi:hypothetical protein